MEIKIIGTVDLGNKIQVFMSKPEYSGLEKNMKETGECSYWWACIGKSYWTSYAKGNCSLREVLGQRMLNRTSLATVANKLGMEVQGG